MAGRKTVATKDYHDNPALGVYVFNPNTGLRAAAEAQGMSEAEQGRQWLRLWTEVMEKVSATGGKCFVMAASYVSRCYIGAQPSSLRNPLG